MTTYSASAVSNTVIANEKGITLQQGRALRDNPIAMFEGAAGAPRMAFEALDTWYVTAGAVGTYVWATSTGGADKNFGSTIAGSSLRPTSAACADSQTTASTFTVAAVLSGTWQCMGYYDDTASSLTGSTLWIRIA